MIQHTHPIQIGSMPVGLVCASDASVAFVRLANFKPIYDLANAFFDKDGFSIADECYDYNTLYRYKDIPDMLAWLKLQNLESPF